MSTPASHDSHQPMKEEDTAIAKSDSGNRRLSIASLLSDTGDTPEQPRSSLSLPSLSTVLLPSLSEVIPPLICVSCLRRWNVSNFTTTRVTCTPSAIKDLRATACVECRVKKGRCEWIKDRDREDLHEAYLLRNGGS